MQACWLRYLRTMTGLHADILWPNKNTTGSGVFSPVARNAPLRKVLVHKQSETIVYHNSQKPACTTWIPGQPGGWKATRPAWLLGVGQQNGPALHGFRSVQTNRGLCRVIPRPGEQNQRYTGTRYTGHFFQQASQSGALYA